MRVGAYLRVAKHIQDVFGHRDARALAVDAHHSASPLAVLAFLCRDLAEFIRVADHARAQAVAAENLPAAVAVHTLQPLLDLALLDQRGNDRPNHADAAA